MNPKPIRVPVAVSGKATPNGFALVVTLTLMVLLSILALGLLSLSSISLRQSSADSAMKEARANARMAILLAIGELQQHLGPDNRININASQLSDDDGISASAAAGRGHWIGVYDSWDSTSTTTRPTPQFREWLVSGSDSEVSSTDTVKTAGPGDLLFWDGEEADGSDRVSVPKVNVNDTSTGNPKGAYAWWIGDENSKALIDMLPNEPASLDRAWSNAQAAPASAFHLDTALAGIDRDSEKLALVASNASLDILAGDRDAAGKVFHDFTTDSYGVVADVARGGLKRDLSLFLDHPVSKPVAPKLPNTDPIYNKGITWEELWLYHNLWRELEDPVPGLQSMTGGNLTGAKILMTKPGVGRDSISAFRNDPFSIYKVPTFIRAQWLLSLWAEKKEAANPSDPSTYDLNLVTDGILTLWNPFDVPIALHPDSYMSLKYWNIPYTFRFSDGSGKISESTFVNLTQGQEHTYTMVFGTSPQTEWGTLGSPDPVVLVPGEVLIMSEGPSAGNPQNFGDYRPGRGILSLGMKAGWNFGKGFGFPVKLDSGKTLTGSTTLSYEAFANTDLAWSGGTSLLRKELYYGPDIRGGRPTPEFFETMGGRFVDLGGTRATERTDVFVPLSGDFPAVDAMTGTGKYPFMMISQQIKTEDDPTSWTRMHNERYSRATLNKLDAGGLAVSGNKVEIKALAGNMDPNMPQLSLNHINRGIAGTSFTDISRGQDTMITMSVPREPPISLGAFQHAIANGSISRYSNGGNALTMKGTIRLPEVSHAISNSYALPVLAANKTEDGTYQDHSYHVNRMLWDSWFLSSIVQRQSPHHAVKQTAKEAYEAFVASPSEPLPNSHFVPWAEDREKAVNALFGGAGDAKPDAHELSSATLVCKGAFNVNSTSKEAWKAMLASLDEAFVPVANGTNTPSSMQAYKADGVPVNSILSAYGSGSSASTAAFSSGDIGEGGNPAQWRGFRKLDHDEIDELAGELVTEIRQRGPFLSMADFINRRAYSDPEMALRGPLQAALDRTVNGDLFKNPKRVSTAPGAAALAFPQAAELPKSLNSPLHVLQADILTAIGSQLTVRSDSFRIRAYGETRDKSGKITATAWCEATVQRTPGYLDPSDPPEASENTSGRNIPAISSDVNKKLGRRFVVKSFRWLGEGDLKI